ncbi:uncharacterized protein LOC130503248 [Raphanus sativus]|uniref:Uncharacterized protein LOC130503248 n=1 Tax=Raphanus sativus TaxID=3726 RepID=A0A9W3CQZ9_RAPSA|nr:uncharacterized protein LOC130503248 [Raphanus sativus]
MGTVYNDINLIHSFVRAVRKKKKQEIFLSTISRILFLADLVSSPTLKSISSLDLTFSSLSSPNPVLSSYPRRQLSSLSLSHTPPDLLYRTPHHHGWRKQGKIGRKNRHGR